MRLRPTSQHFHLICHRSFSVLFFYHVFLPPQSQPLLGFDSTCWPPDSVRRLAPRCSCHMHGAALPMAEHMCACNCTRQRRPIGAADMDIIDSQSLPESHHAFFKRWKNFAYFSVCKTVSHCVSPWAAVWLGWQPSECEMLPLAGQVWSEFTVFCLMGCYCNFKPLW